MFLVRNLRNCVRSVEQQYAYFPVMLNRMRFLVHCYSYNPTSHLGVAVLYRYRAFTWIGTGTNNQCLQIQMAKVNEPQYEDTVRYSSNSMNNYPIVLFYYDKFVPPYPLVKSFVRTAQFHNA
jgi:hypothetical protein